jgi:alkanesulfonate monooxygenase SsuD/methylene tetrahydromethanopterin reductase-like flavin-dependent oxidoreductase (luciferase family)
VILGVGSGHLKPEFAVLRADYDRRGKVTDEYVQAIAAAWLSENASFAGETVAFRDVMVSRASIAVRARRSGSAATRARRSGGRRATATAGCRGELTPDECAAAVQLARRVRAEAGRPDEFEVVANPLGLAASADELLATVAPVAHRRCHGVPRGIAAERAEEHLERLAWFGREVIGPGGGVSVRAPRNRHPLAVFTRAEAWTQ